ncbi:hypothetical protein AC249_AIPGENE21502 [Exaiptasia diaphana]|nr:hypothetical protein AC249_AIPGENE21502 [Exaiptasia diaphana]
MAARFSREEVLRQVLDDDEIERESDHEEDEEEFNEKDYVKLGMEKIESMIDEFDGGEGFNSDLFRENAKRALMPILFSRSFLTLRKLMTMHKALHPKSDVDRLYLKRKDGGRGLLSIEDTVSLASVGLIKYIEKSEERIITAVRGNDFCDGEDEKQFKN